MPKPGRPRKESIVAKSRGTLGESSGSDDSEADETTVDRSRNVSKFRAAQITAGQSSPETRSRRPKASEAFRTPENEPNVTDYGLEFTTSHIQNPSPTRCSTLRTGSSQEESATRKEAETETERASRARVDRTGGEGSIEVTPTTSGPPKKTTKQKKKQPTMPKGKSQQQPNKTSDRSESESSQASEESEEEVAEKSRPRNTAPEKATKQGPNKSKGKSQAKNTLTESNSKAQPKETTEKTMAKAAKKKSRKQTAPQVMRHFLREVKTLQNRTDFLLPRLPFSRVIREIIMGLSQEVTKITPTALEALQTASEMYMTQRLQDAYMLTLHRGRVTLDVRDMQLINFLKLDM